MRTSRWPRRLLVTMGILVVVGLVLAVVVRTPSPIGHWDSAEGRARYLTHYDESFARLPTPSRTLDVRTDYGIVRAYHFKGSGTAALPMLLLPGTASGSPVWADNMASLLKVGDVYLVDMLGEPGRSIQERPINDDADKAAWLQQTLSALPDNRFHLVGMSLGGWTAMNLAVRPGAQTHLASVTMLDAVFTFDDLPLGTVIRSIPASVPWLPRSWRDSFSSYTAGGAEVKDAPEARMIEAGMQHYRMVQPQPARITPEQLRGLTVPSLAIIAGRSVMHDPATAERTARENLPGGRVTVFSGAHHSVNGEYPDQIAAEIGRLITDVEGDR